MKNLIKNQKGSITILVIASILFILIVLVNLF